MADSLKVGAHWALIEVSRATGNSDAWVGRWAVFKELSPEAYVATRPDPSALVSGATGPQRTEDEARRIAELDARRSEAVLSGTYRH
jgi:hypothetical protein